MQLRLTELTWSSAQGTRERQSQGPVDCHRRQTWATSFAAPPGAHDIQYCAAWVLGHPLPAQGIAMRWSPSRPADGACPSGKCGPRDRRSHPVRGCRVQAYQTLAAYMIRLKVDDFEPPEGPALARAGNLDIGSYPRFAASLAGADRT